MDIGKKSLSSQKPQTRLGGSNGKLHKPPGPEDHAPPQSGSHKASITDIYAQTIFSCQYAWKLCGVSVLKEKQYQQREITEKRK